MIPSDVGVQLKTQTNPGVSPVRPVAEIPADLPDLKTGQAFRAQIQEVLPENTYKALVAGKSLTLSLAAGAKAGDTLDLVVVDRTPRMIVAQQANSTAGVNGEMSAEPYQNTTLSRTGQLLMSLLAREGASATPAALNAGRPLVADMPVDAADLAQQLPVRLAQAVTSSGLFYEAHQVQWALGQRTSASLLAEPQGKHSAVLNNTPEQPTGAEKSALAGRQGDANASPLALLRTLFGVASGNEAAGNAHADNATTQGVAANALDARAAFAVPDDLRPLLQQQLEAAATHRLAWHGEVWPEQTMRWEIERDVPQAEVTGEAPDTWHTSLHLALPRLGEIDAQVKVVGNQVHLNLAMSAAVASDLVQALPLLQQALADAGLTLHAVQTARQASGQAAGNAGSTWGAGGQAGRVRLDE